MVSYRVVMLAALLLLPLLAPQAAAAELNPGLRLELDFDSSHHLVLDLQVAAGDALAGDGEEANPAELATHDFSNEPLNNLTRALLVGADGTFSGRLLVGQLLFGYRNYEKVNFTTLNVQLVQIYPNGFHLRAVAQIDAASDPVVIRPLRCLYDNDAIDRAKVGQVEVVVSTSNGLGIDTGGRHLNHFRWLREDGAPGETFSNRDLYLDPTDIFGVGDKYDIKDDSLTVKPARPYSSPTVMGAIFVAALLLGLVAVRWLGRDHPTRKGRRLTLGVYYWMVVAALYPLAFIPFSTEIFLLATLLVLGRCVTITYLARRRTHIKNLANLLDDGLLTPLEEAAEGTLHDGSDRQITDEVIPGEAELLDELLADSEEARTAGGPPGVPSAPAAEAPFQQPAFNNLSFADEAATESYTTCGHCGAPMDSSWKACPHCSTEVGAAPQALAEMPTETYAEMPAETYAEAPADPYAEVPAETYAEAPADPYAELPAETYAEAPADPYAELPAETYAEAPADPYAEMPAETYAEAPADPYAEMPAETYAEAPAEPEPAAPEAAAPAPPAGGDSSMDDIFSALDGLEDLKKNLKR